MAIRWKDMTHTAAQIDNSVNAAEQHISNSGIHMTAAEKSKLASLENYDDTEIRGLIAAKQDALTFDETPTENSQNPVYSGGIFPLQNALAAIIDETYKVNVLAPRETDVTVGDEVQFHVNPDGSTTATVLAATTASRSVNWYAALPAGTWHFSTNQPLSGAYPAPCYGYLYTAETIALDYGNRQIFTLSEATTLRCFLQVRSGQAAGSVFTFCPMVCRPEWYAVSNRYVPYTAETGGVRNA